MWVDGEFEKLLTHLSREWGMSKPSVTRKLADEMLLHPPRLKVIMPRKKRRKEQSSILL